MNSITFSPNLHKHWVKAGNRES